MLRKYLDHAGLPDSFSGRHNHTFQSGLPKQQKTFFHRSQLFKSEKSLVRQFVTGLHETCHPWGPVNTILEFDYRRGRTDILALTVDGKCLIAFEAKLRDWRKALHQAYRNTSFVHRSYVVLPKKAAMQAQCYSGEFTLRKVGLCYTQKEHITILVEPEILNPIEPWLHETAKAAINDSNPRPSRPRNRRTESL